MDLFDSMKCLLLTVEKGSLSAAAEALGISPTMAGKHLQRLEQRLGVKLMQRTTRRQQLTPFGEDYVQRCRDILGLVNEAELEAQRARQAPAGVLRVSAPLSFGSEALMPAMAGYLAAHPAVKLDLVLSDRVVDLVEEGFEAALRIGELPPSGLISRSLAPYRLMICASPDYLARCGRPERAEQLSAHECLSYAPAGLRHWRLRTPAGNTLRVAVNSRVQVNQGQALRAAALNGMGIVLQPEVLLQADVAAGRLVQLFADHELPSRAMSLVYLPDRYRGPRLRSFVDFVIERFAEQPATDLPDNLIHAQ